MTMTTIPSITQIIINKQTKRFQQNIFDPSNQSSKSVFKCNLVVYMKDPIIDESEKKKFILAIFLMSKVKFDFIFNLEKSRKIPYNLIDA